MIRNKQGYSLIVLIIAMAVIVIISATAISTVNTSKEDRLINNFIYDINNIEASAVQYYSSTGTIPTLGTISNVSALGSQLDKNDSDVYYKLDLTKLNLNNIHEMDKTYVINEGSLRVYMLEGIEYKGNRYYTTTSDLMGTNANYETQDVDVVCTVSPSVWTRNAEIRVIVPDSGKNAAGWLFKYNKGPKDISFFRTDGTEFSYGNTINVNTNGVISVYIQDNFGKEYVKNVVVKNIDEYYPKYEINNGDLTLRDDETGIKEVRYKVKSEYDANKDKFTDEQQAEKTLADFYLVDGKGNTVNSLKEDIMNYNRQLAALQTADEELDDDYDSITVEQLEALSDEERTERDNVYASAKQDLTQQLNTLNTTYSHILNPNTRYVLYVEDMSGNAIAIDEEMLTFAKVCEMFNITN